MLAVFSLLLVLSLGHCQDNDLPSGYEIESSINRTIEEVERQVRENPKLPRLTRQQIVNILENITLQDLNAYEDSEKLEKARKLYQRALMVVLPYNVEKSAGGLKDLYTKAPITQIIPDRLNSDQFKKDTKQEVEKSLGSLNLYTKAPMTQIIPDRSKSNQFTKDTKQEIEKSGSLYTKAPMTQIIPDRSNSDQFTKDTKQEENEVRNFETSEASVENLVSTQNFYKPTTKNQSKNQYKNHRETYSEVQGKLPLKETLKLDSTPVKFSFNLENLQKSAYTDRPTTKRYPVYKNNENKSDLEIVYSTSVTEPTTKAVPKEIVIDLDRSKATQNVLTSSQWRYNAPPNTLKPTLPTNIDKIPFLPTVNRPEDTMIDQMFSTERSNVQNGRTTLEPYISSEQPLYVTPMSTETSPRVKYSSTYSVNAAGFRASTTSTSMRPEVMDLLESIGLRPDNYSNVEDVYKKNKNLLEKSPDLNSIQTTISGLVPAGSDSPSIHDQNTFESSGFEIKKGMENLTPEVQMLFQRFGLQTSNLDVTTTTTPRTVKYNSYTNFKPLPTSSVKDQEMKEFLAKFGLIDNRRQKSMRTTEASLIEAVPYDMRGILSNIGLISQKPAVRDMETETTNHVFKPHEVNVKDEEQRSKINELLDTVKLVQQGKADIQNVKKVANDLIESTKTLKDGPDPLKLEEIIRNYSKELRNEVKRQQEQVTTVTEQQVTTEETTPSIATTESASTLTTSTDSTKSADQLAVDTSKDSSSTTSNLMALEESFGGTTPVPDPVLPPKRKSGLYFLVDWNTFLEVGEDDKEKINLRFQPKVGDRTRFLPVSVP